jgi:hypothetical protein
MIDEPALFFGAVGEFGIKTTNSENYHIYANHVQNPD